MLTTTFQYTTTALQYTGIPHTVDPILRHSPYTFLHQLRDDNRVDAAILVDPIQGHEDRHHHALRNRDIGVFFRVLRSSGGHDGRSNGRSSHDGRNAETGGLCKGSGGETQKMWTDTDHGGRNVHPSSSLDLSSRRFKFVAMLQSGRRSCEERDYSINSSFGLHFWSTSGLDLLDIFTTDERKISQLGHSSFSDLLLDDVSLRRPLTCSHLLSSFRILIYL